VEYSEQACVFYDAISVPGVNKKIQFLLFLCSSQNFSFRFLLDELTADFCKSILMIIMRMLKITTAISRFNRLQRSECAKNMHKAIRCQCWDAVAFTLGLNYG